MAVVTSFWLYDIFLLIGTILLATYLRWRLYSKYYWRKRGIPYEEPLFLLGNTATVNITTTSIERINEIYTNNKKHKLFGMWLYTKPILLVQDLALIKNILVKDFQYFHDRGLTINEEKEPLQGE